MEGTIMLVTYRQQAGEGTAAKDASTDVARLRFHRRYEADAPTAELGEEANNR